MDGKTITVNGKSYSIIKLLGKGKGGYSYLASCDDTLVVAKKFTTSHAATITLATKLKQK